jgi:hypothetical protein
MTLSSGSKSELLWWIKNLNHSHRSLVISKPDLVLTTDASLLGWGAVFDKQETGGQWSSVENKFHINYLEMKAILLGLQSLCNNAHDTHQPRSQGLSFCHLGESLAAAGHVPPRFWEVNLIVTVRGVGKERVCSVLKLLLWVMKFTVNLQQEILN